jgi:aspartyl-tRNA synthetase
MLRNQDAGSIRASHAGQTVTLAGWVARRRDHGGVAFIDLRDATGSVQVVIRDEKLAGQLRAEWCLQITGEVALRPAGNENSNIPTGAIEIIGDNVVVLSESAPLPFPVDSGNESEISEEVRLRYRYLDLRREGPAANLRLRSKVTTAIRNVMESLDFLEIETPYLTRSTPEGARDFLVPVRLQPGSWYALPQSPQLFKQLLMVAGMERYYQIARCFRDEDFRADRQPEFTQLDIEMSFVDQADILAVAEKILVKVWKEAVGYDIPTPIRHMTYADAMNNYGSDKPDLRFGLQLTEVTDFFTATPFRVFQAPYVGAVVMPGGADSPRRELDAWQDWAKARGAKGIAYILVNVDGTLGGPVSKNISEVEQAGIAALVGAQPGDAIFFAAGERPVSSHVS